MVDCRRSGSRPERGAAADLAASSLSDPDAGSTSKRVIRWKSRNRSSISSLVQRLDPIGAEVLDVERGEHRPVRHRLAQDRGIEHRVACGPAAVEVAEEAAREAVPGAGRVSDVLEQVARDREEVILGRRGRRRTRRAWRRSRPVPSPSRARGARRQVRLAGQLADLGVVEHQAIDLGDRRLQRLPRGRRARSSSSRGAANCAWASTLGRWCWSSGSMFPRKSISDSLGCLGELRVEVGEDVELGVVGVGDVHVVLVVAAPEEASDRPRPARCRR